MHRRVPRNVYFLGDRRTQLPYKNLRSRDTYTTRESDSGSVDWFSATVRTLCLSGASGSVADSRAWNWLGLLRKLRVTLKSVGCKLTVDFVAVHELDFFLHVRVTKPSSAVVGPVYHLVFITSPAGGGGGRNVCNQPSMFFPSFYRNRQWERSSL
jgi:hypothetical protein